MRRTFREADFEALAELSNRFYPPEFAVDAEVLRMKTAGCDLFDWGASTIATDSDGQVLGFVAIKRSAARVRWKGNPDVAHITTMAFTEPQIGVDLLADAKILLMDRGLVSLQFGGDADHLFPGFPVNCHGLGGYLMVEGFEASGETYDVERDLADYTNPSPCPTDCQVRRLTPADGDALDSFLRREFPGRWHWDVLHKAGVEGIGNAVVGIFRDGQLLGFALIQDGSHREPIGGFVWRQSLSEGGCSLGPIGVAASTRGQGLGHALLGGALEILRDGGGRRCIIDWTGLLDFYGRHGFVKSRTYRSSVLNLEA